MKLKINQNKKTQKATLTPSTLSIARGANATSTVTITRVGGLTGDVALTAEAISNSGITVAFAPSTITSANTTSTATVTVGAAVPPVATPRRFVPPALAVLRRRHR